jgi:type II secretory pathway component GspD/PulD (secretin)
MTDTQSYHARVVGTEVASLEEVTAGTRLQIKPRIVKSADTNTPSRVWLTMELQDGGFESVTVDAMPMTRSSTLETQASVLDSHSILLAGYMRDIKESAGWGIPYLRDIPWIGWIFGGASYRDETVQRLFILTPYVIDADEPDYVRVQATRQRDITLEEKVESDKHSDDMERKKRNEQIEEMREIREDNFEEWYYRDSKERKFRKERREDEFKAGRKAWEAEFEERKKKYEDEKKAEKAADAK